MERNSYRDVTEANPMKVAAKANWFGGVLFFLGLAIVLLYFVGLPFLQVNAPDVYAYYLAYEVFFIVCLWFGAAMLLFGPGLIFWTMTVVKLFA